MLQATKRSHSILRTVAVLCRVCAIIVAAALCVVLYYALVSFFQSLHFGVGALGAFVVLLWAIGPALLIILSLLLIAEGIVLFLVIQNNIQHIASDSHNIAITIHKISEHIPQSMLNMEQDVAALAKALETVANNQQKTADQLNTLTAKLDSIAESSRATATLLYRK